MSSAVASDTQEGSRVDTLLFWSLCCLFFFIPVATSPAVIAGALFLGIWILSGKFISERNQWLNQPWVAPVVVFMLLPWIGLFWTKDLHSGLKFATKSYYWLYAFAIASVRFPKHSSSILMKSFLSGLLLVSVISLLLVVGIIPWIKGLPAITEGTHLTGSLLLVFGILVLSFYFSEATAKKDKILIVLLMLLFFVILFTGIGRIGYLAFALLSPLALYTFFRKRGITKALVCAVLITGVLLLSPTVRNRIGTAMNEAEKYQHADINTSIGLRFHMWKGAIKIFLEHPVAGVGTGGYSLAMRKYEVPQLAPEFRNFSQPHNSFLYEAASFGMIGLASLVWLFYVFLKKGWQNRTNSIGFSVLAYGLVLLIGSLTDSQILSLATAKLFALFTGIRAEQDES